MSSENNAKMFSFERIFDSYPTTMRKIIQNIPLHLRFDVGAINEQFYELVCELDKSKYKIKIKGEIEILSRFFEVKLFHIDDIVSSILMSRRREFDELQIKNLVLTTHNLQQLIKVADKYGEGIKTFKIKRCFVGDWQLLGELLVKLPSLENWTVLGHPQDGTNPSNIQPVLKNLKNFFLDGAPPFAFFIAPDTLQSFSFSCNDDIYASQYSQGYTISGFIQTQSKLKSLVHEVEDYQCLSHNEIHQQMSGLRPLRCLEEITMRGAYSDPFVSLLIRNNPELKKIDLSRYLDEEIFPTILRHGTKVESISVTSYSNQIFVYLLQLPRLKNLTEVDVTISFEVKQNLIDFSMLTMPSVKILKMSAYCSRRSDEYDGSDALGNFGRCWENIEQLQLDTFCGETLDADIILQSFPKLRSLRMGQFRKPANSEEYPKIEELELTSEINALHLLNMINVFPNLKKLAMENSDHVSILEDLLQFNVLQSLAYHGKLKNLKMYMLCDRNPSNDSIDAIKDLCRKIPNFHIAIRINIESFWKELVANLEIDNDFCKLSKISSDW